MTSLTGGNAAANDIRKLMEQIIAERDAKFAPKQEGDEATPRGGMFDKPEVKANDGDVITDLLGYLEQKRTEALDSYQSKVMRRSTKPLPKPEDIDVSSFLSEAGLSSQPEPLTFTSDTAPALGEPSWLQVADNAFLDPSKEPAKPTLSEELLSRERKPVEELTDDEKFLRTGELPKEGLMSPVPPVKSLRPRARPEGLTDDDMGLPDDDNYMGVLDDGPTQDLLDRIALGEGADPKKLKAQNKYGIGATEYDMVYGYGSALAPDKPVTEMTMKELEAYQRKLIAATKGKVKGTSKGTSAVGKYQVIKTSLFGANGTAEKPQKNSWADKLGLTADTIYTPAIQEKIGLLALKEAGYNSYIHGKRSQDSFQNKIANIWASVAKADGTDKYGQGIHTVKKDLEPMFKVLAPIKTEDTAVATSLRPKARP